MTTMTTTPGKALKLGEQLCFALYSTSLAMSKLYKPLLSELGLTYPQYLIMLVLWEQEGLTSSELAKQLTQDLGALSPVVKRLEKEGLLQRKRSREDERVVRLFLTEAGKKLRDSAESIPEQVLCISGLGMEEAKALRKQLEELRQALSTREKSE
ncbi:Transcriptional regulator [Hahella chejuensis KCTC 2396]|uniref:Transcriptional regulator n=1 Tax=Hahella chejuensis (strain KCTC 2396) TaxID=349521 RepID=Q2SPL6_HAHCH|nr:MarR family transcriptional regulator [Hahella chejuensis]ABC27408.1 Transcriptional regulator [Hahella chejuensis KCTC 2396]